MVRFSPDKVELDLTTKGGRALAHLIVQTLWTWRYYADPERQAKLDGVARMIDGSGPAVTVEIVEDGDGC